MSLATLVGPLALSQLGGVMPPEEEEKSWLEKLGIITGEEDRYKKAMGIPSKDFVSQYSKPDPAPQGGMGELIAMLNATRQSRRDRGRKDQDFRNYIMSPALRQLMGG